MAFDTLLTVAIPTYKRSGALKRCMESLLQQLDGKQQRLIHILVCDDDPTSSNIEIISDMRRVNSARISYYKNNENMGPDKNFLQCIELARDSTYFWLLGDDDFVNEGKVKLILDWLMKVQPDCVFLECRGAQWSSLQARSPLVISSLPVFLAYINFYSTFMSSYVLKLEVIKRAANPLLVGSNLIQVGWLFAAAKEAKIFCLIPQQVFSGGEETTGGYDFLKVFAIHYWSVWKEAFGNDAGNLIRAAAYFNRFMMHLFFFPAIISAVLGQSRKFRFNSMVTFDRCRAVFKNDFLFWIFSAPLFYLPNKIRRYFILFFLPFKILNCLMLALLVFLFSITWRLKQFVVVRDDAVCEG